MAGSSTDIYQGINTMKFNIPLLSSVADIATYFGNVMDRAIAKQEAMSVVEQQEADLEVEARTNKLIKTAAQIKADKISYETEAEVLIMEAQGEAAKALYKALTKRMTTLKVEVQVAIMKNDQEKAKQLMQTLAEIKAGLAKAESSFTSTETNTVTTADDVL